MHKKIRREISGEVFRAIFDLRLHLVVDILNFEPFVTRVKNLDATVKEKSQILVELMNWVLNTQLKEGDNFIFFDNLSANN